MILTIHERDTVGVALQDLPAGTRSRAIRGGKPCLLRITEPIPAGHKVALADHQPGDAVIKYGHPIGIADRLIPEGCHVHTHNIHSGLTGMSEYSYHPRTAAPVPSGLPDFQGYLRPDGRAGIRNEIWILPTVGCINRTVRQLERMASARLSDFPGIDGIYAWEHPYGCSQLGDDLENTRAILCSLAQHPNAGGVLVVGLGCENNRLSQMEELLRGADPSRIRFMECQSSANELEEGLRLILELCGEADRDVRISLPCDRLVIGLKCGGSDAFSGITANPLLGVLTDRLAASGASAVMGEVPEMFGAEQILMDRCADEDVFRGVVEMIRSYQDYYLRNGLPVFENPSPGNKEGGITTLEEKSLGCIRKSGDASVADVIPYGRQRRSVGLSLLHSPGNDLVSSTALAAAGAQMILFTTGRGTPFGSAVPTVKISSRSALAQRKPDWIDFDAGALVSGGDMQTLAGSLLDLVAEIASGRQTRNEINGYRDIALFKNGVTL